MNFKKFLLGYIIVWIVFIVGVCVWEWNVLKGFQADYEVDRKGVPSILDSGNGAGGHDVNALAGQGTQPDTEAPTPQVVEFVADSSMVVLVNGTKVTPKIVCEVQDIIYEAATEVTGVVHTKNRYSVKLFEEDVMQVLDANGNPITPVDNDYVAGIYVKDDNKSMVAISLVESYVKHVNGLMTFEEIPAIMRRESQAYKAVRSSQESLKWMIPATEINFVKEETGDLQIFDENHFACDVNIDLTKKANSSSGREYVVDESVSFRVLCENVNGSWHIYSFQTK